MTIIDRWEKLLDQPGVGIFFDLRDVVARANQREELADAVAELRSRHDPAMRVLARGCDAPPGVIVPEVLDLRVPGTPYPHVAFARSPRPDALVYA
jgi:hypothetical protein